MKFIPLAVLSLVSIVMVGCATTVKPTYVSPTQYQAMNCAQLAGHLTGFNNTSIMVFSLPSEQVWGSGLV